MTTNHQAAKRSCGVQRTSVAYDYAVIQSGSMPLDPSGRQRPALAHRCASTLVWTHREDVPIFGQNPRSHDICILTDPCLVGDGVEQLTSLLGELAKSLSHINFVFETHQHGDHQLNVAVLADRLREWPYQRYAPPPPGIRIVPTPGHSVDSSSLVFTAPNGEHVWIAGDAILSEVWLRQWAYYRPNGYDKSEIIDTWRSVALILAEADVVVPGHGLLIPITIHLLRDLSATFLRRAKYAGSCPDVGISIRERITQMERFSA